MQKEQKNSTATKLAAVLLFIVWSLVTVILGISVLGWVALIFMWGPPDLEDRGNRWFDLPGYLVSKIK